MDVGATGTKSTPKGAVAILGASVLAALWAIAMMTPVGRVTYIYVFKYLEFYMGVLVLVSISITIMVGLVSTDRLVLSIRQRVFLQSIHRTTGVMAVVALGFHLWTKTAEGHIRLIDIAIPFIAQGNTLYIGFGQLSAYILILVIWTGVARARFIGRGKPWMWRAIHSIPYLMWPIALLHGLGAGRPAKTWVIVSYVVCVLMVLIGLAVRLSVSLNRRKDFASPAGVGGPAGQMVATSQPAGKAPRRGREKPAPEPERLGPVAMVDTFQPASPMQVQTAPPVPDMPPQEAERGRRFADEDLVAPAPRPRRPMGDDEIDYEEPRGGGRRYAGEDTSTRMRRPERSDLEDTSTRMRRIEMDDTSTRMRRIEMDDTSTRMRRIEMDDTSTRMRRPDFDEPPPRGGRRYAEDDEDLAPRSRRRPADQPEYDEAPRGRRRADADFDDVPRQRSRYDDEPPSRRSARYEPRYSDFGPEGQEVPRDRRDRGADADRADSGRHSRSGFVDMADDPNYPAGDETPTLVDMASRRARRADQQAAQPIETGRGARRNGRGRMNDDVADDQYWSQLRGEAN
ncbi:translation initiation factor III [Paractinoplanes durhamensis]|uniref:translation initiation factor III n=1 Tax=Paractinoplanes durhamensis TaxID=113563 RepID=UPI001EF2562D|nr:translation initiation factor III [Actinoplanes durhamensis]